MNGNIFEELRQRYLNLRGQYESGQLSQEQFAADVGKLQVRDEAGTWWTIDARNGDYLRYDGSAWVTGTPPTTRAAVQTPITETLKGSPSAVGKGSWLKSPEFTRFASIVAIVMPLVTALFWFIYSSLLPSSEGWDCLTPLILAIVPIALQVFQTPIDQLLLPVQPFRQRFSRPMLLGAAFATPIVLGLIVASVSKYGYGAVRFTLVTGMLITHALVRTPEVQS
jgi:hypothetical protein